MRASDFAKWVDLAKEQGASRLVVRRARRKGGALDMFTEETFASLDVPGLLTRLRDEIIDVQRKPSGQFEVTAWGKDKETPLMRDRLDVGKGDEGGADDETVEPTVLVNRQLATLVHDAVRASIDGVREGAMAFEKTNAQLVSVVELLSKRQVEFEGKVGDVLLNAFTLAELREEKEERIAKSRDRRELGKLALAELGPILGAVVTKLGKTAGPALTAFLQSLTDEQLAKWTADMTPEQLAAFGSVVEELDREKQERAGKRAAPQPTNGVK